MSKENIKCFLHYSLVDSEVKVAEFANPSQREFLMSEAQTVLKKIGRRATTMLETMSSSNGVWYYKTDKECTQMLLTAKDTPQNMINMFVSRAAGMTTRTNFADADSVSRLRYNLADSIKLFNANNMNKLQQLNENVDELHGIMKNNVGRLINNMGDLQIVEKKSSVMSALSANFESDSRKLEQKMKRKQLCIRLVCVAVVLAIVALLVYLIFG